MTMIDTMTRAITLAVLLLLVAGCSEGKVSTGDEDGNNSDVMMGDTSPDNNPNDTSTDNTLPDGNPGDSSPDTPNGCVESSTRCSMTGNVETCTGGQWMISMACPNGCSSGVCTSDTMTGDCSNPLPLSVGQTVVGTTATNYNLNTWGSACTQSYGSNSLGTETVYELTVNSMQMVEFTVTALDPTYVGIYLRANCTDPGSQLHSVCDGNVSPGGQFKLKTLLSPGTYFLIVDSFDDSDPGRFQLEVGTTTLESCENQIPQLIDISGGQQTVIGDTADGLNSADWLQFACPQDAFQTNGKERSYAFSLPAPGRVVIEATPINPATSQIGLYLRVDCDDRYSQVGEPDSAGCGYTSGITPARIDTTLDAGTYYLFVDDFASSAGDESQEFRLVVTPP